MKTNDFTTQVQLYGLRVKLEIQAPKLTPDEEEKIRDEINEAIATKNNSCNKLRPLVHKLDVGLVVGCSLQAYFKTHFTHLDKKSNSELYKEAKAGRTEASLFPNSPIGETPRQILLEFGKLKKLEDQQAALAEVMENIKPGSKLSTAVVSAAVKKAFFNGAEVGDPRVENSFMVSEEELFKKGAVKSLNKLKSNVEKLGPETQINAPAICEKIDELVAALSTPLSIAPVIPIDCQPQSDIVEAASALTDSAETPTVNIIAKAPLPLPAAKSHSAETFEQMMYRQFGIKIPIRSDKTRGELRQGK